MATTLATALENLDDWPDEVLVGQLFNVATGGHAAQDIFGFGDADPAKWQRAHEHLKQVIAQYHVGAVTYFPPGGDHEPTADIRASLLDLQTAAEIPLLVATDQENGTVARVRAEATHLPGAMALAAADDLDLVSAVARTTAEQLRAVGVSQTFAPVIDVIMRPDNPGVNIRCISAIPAVVAETGAVVVQGLAEGHVASTLKHFPGYGSANVDPHLSLPSIDISYDEWYRTERVPFEVCIAAGADSIMLAHALFPALDPDNGATFSPAIVDGLLRRDLGFEGVIVTDAMDMGGADRPEGPAEACVLALQAGVDQILMPADLPAAHAAVVAAVRDGRLSRERLRASARRILRLKHKLALDDAALPALDVLHTPEHGDLARRGAAASVALRDAAVAATVTPGTSVLLVQPGVDPQKRGAHPGEVLRPILEAAGHAVTDIEWGSPGDALPTLTQKTDAAVVVLRDAFKDRLPVADLIAQLREAGTEVVVVVTRSPFDAASVAASVPVLLTYGDNAFALEAAGHVLTGAAAAPGRLPMPVPHAPLLSDAAGES